MLGMGLCLYRGSGSSIFEVWTVSRASSARDEVPC